MTMKIGDRVIDSYGNVGIIERMYDDFSACAFSCMSMTGKEWLDQQAIPFGGKELKERWYSVKCDSGGAIWSCESRLTNELRTMEE